MLVGIDVIVCQGREWLGQDLRPRQFRRNVGNVRGRVGPSCICCAGAFPAEPRMSMACRNAACSAGVGRGGTRYAAAGRGGETSAGSCPRGGGDGAHWCCVWRRMRQRGKDSFNLPVLLHPFRRNLRRRKRRHTWRQLIAQRDIIALLSL